MECNYFNLNIGYFDRSDYVSGVIQELVFILTLERIINVCMNNYISLWRTILLEFYRNLNHSLNITTCAIDMGLFTTMLWKFEEREKSLSFNGIAEFETKMNQYTLLNYILQLKLVFAILHTNLTTVY